MEWEKLGKNILELYRKDIEEIDVLNDGLIIIFIDEVQSKHIRIFSILEEATKGKIEIMVSVQPAIYYRDEDEIQTVRILVKEIEKWSMFQ